MNERQRPLEGKVAVVTGGGRGIGSEICRVLAANGAAVVVNYSRSAKEAEQVASEIVAAGGKAAAIGFDVSNEEAVEKGFAAINEQFGGVSVLVNNAGIAVDGLLLRHKIADWDRTIAVNLTSCFLCCRAAAKSMMKARWGRIINLSSVIGEMGNGGQVAYSASKSGIFGLTKSLAKELGSRGITCNAITPGYIATEMTAVMSDEQRNKLLENIPLGRLGTVADVAHAVAMLAAPEAGYITGEVIAVNGGLHM